MEKKCWTLSSQTIYDQLILMEYNIRLNLEKDKKGGTVDGNSTEICYSAF